MNGAKKNLWLRHSEAQSAEESHLKGDPSHTCRMTDICMFLFTSIILTPHPSPQHYASLRYTSSQSSSLACSFCIPKRGEGNLSFWWAYAKKNLSLWHSEAQSTEESFLFEILHSRSGWQRLVRILLESVILMSGAKKNLIGKEILHIRSGWQYKVQDDRDLF